MAAAYTFSALRSLVAEPNRQVRDGVRSGLQRHGLREIVDCDSALRAHEYLSQHPFDLIIMDADLEDSDVYGMVRLIRDKKLGKDPFSNIILFANPPDGERARRLVDSGADVIIVKPVAVSLLYTKIGQLIESRKPFVVTSDYIGPDRRAAPRPGTMVVPQIEAPSSLKQRALGKVDDALHFRAVNNVWAGVSTQKIERQIFQVGWLLDRIFPDGRTLGADLDVLKFAQHLVMVAGDLLDRLVESKKSDLAPICQSLKENARQVRDNQGEVSPGVTQALYAAAKELKEKWARPMTESA
jgi:CheY-like chemotaxis protein